MIKIAYNVKKVDYGDTEKKFVYQIPVRTGVNTSAKVRKNYKEFSDKKKEKSDERRIKYYKKKVHDVIDLAKMNKDLDTAITLTFRENITDYEVAVKDWELFLKRLRYYCKNDLKYICTWELQKKRSKKLGLGKGGVIHFHALVNTGFIEHSKLEKIWGKGYVWINKIGTDKKRVRAITYFTKYTVKEIVEQVKNGNARGKRFVFTSNNLNKPTIATTMEETTIMEETYIHLENMICDGSYPIKDEQGRVINYVDYIEYKK